MLLSEVAGIAGAFHVLKTIEQSPVPLAKTQLLAVAEANGMADPGGGLDLLEDRGLVRQLGVNVFLSTVGRRTLLLLEAINGRDLQELLPLLRASVPALGYEIVREGMTTRFISELSDRPDFGHLYLCSPWISLEPSLLRLLTDALIRAERHSGSPVRFLVITRPLPRGDEEVSSLRQLEALGAEIAFKPDLHAKLYIREPSPRGGILGAIFGSQNLTRSRYLELGIYIRNDSEIIRQLVSYFFEVYGFQPWHEGGRK